MLFNSYAFLFVFLPLALAGYHFAARLRRTAVILWLGIASLAFYAIWRPAYVVLLVGSIAVNFFIASLISRAIHNCIIPRLLLWTGVAINLGALAYFKYLFPILASLIPGHTWPGVVLPLGISFFTFTQIAYLIDLEQGSATQENLPGYLLFVTFFPHLIAGPILHHSEMMPQFHREGRYRLSLSDCTVGFSWFVMGLAKKVLLADTFANTANVVYSHRAPLTAILSWRGVLCYALQLYFDFSGYSDMALGLARMFSIEFPLNFASPYKATSIIDYWQRWHITLTRYVTAYLYNPLQLWITNLRQSRGQKVSRKALATPGGFLGMMAFPLLITFLITGVWHGAGPKYLVFGLIHGVYLTVNHAWRISRPRSTAIAAHRNVGSILLTFIAVVAAQTFFRGDSCRHALSILAGTLGLHGRGSWRLPNENPAAAFADLAAVAAGLFIVWFLPNTQQILRRFKPAIDLTQWDEVPTPSVLLWKPSLPWAFALCALFFLSLVYLQQPSTFLYFQF